MQGSHSQHVGLANTWPLLNSITSSDLGKRAVSEITAIASCLGGTRLSISSNVPFPNNCLFFTGFRNYSRMTDQSSTTNGVPEEDLISPLDNSSTASITNFVVELQYSDVPAEAREKLRLLLLDYIGVAAAATRLADSSEAFTKACKTLDPGIGPCTVFANRQCWSPPYAALMNGALSHSLDFDDTHASALLHPGGSVLSAALTEAESQNSQTQQFFCAIAAGFEVTCRLGVTLGAGGYERGFHNTCTAGLFGAISSIAKLRRFGQDTLEKAFGIAISKVSGSMQYLSNGSLNKRLHPGFAAHDAFICCAFAEAGVKGAAQPLEGNGVSTTLMETMPTSERQ